MTHVPDVSRSDRILGCLLGGAIGDALGAPVEFWSSERIVREFPDGVRTYLPSGCGDLLGLITDDTQMTLFTLEGLLRAKRDPSLDPIEEVHRSYVEWWATQKLDGPPEDADPGSLVAEPWLYSRRAPGVTCMSALRQAVQDGALGKAADNDSKGCGAVMRSAPFALIGMDDAADLAMRAAALTHGHPSGQVSAGALVVMVESLLAGEALPGSIGAALDWCDGVTGGQETREALMRALAADRLGSAPTAETIQRLGAGWVGEEALAIAVFCALSFPERDQVLDALSLAVSHGGDSDSTGAICGHLVGALHGVQALPPALARECEGHATVRRLAWETEAAGQVRDSRGRHV